MIRTQFNEDILEGGKAAQAQSSSREMKLGVTPLSIKNDHINAGGTFYLDTASHVNRKYYTRVLKHVYVGPTNSIYFVTSDKEIFTSYNAKGIRVNKHGIPAEKRYTIRRFDMVRPEVIDIPSSSFYPFYPHILREYSTQSRAIARVKKLVREEWMLWIERVNDLTYAYRAIKYTQEEEEQRLTAIKNGTYVYTPKELFKMPLI